MRITCRSAVVAGVLSAMLANCGRAEERLLQRATKVAGDDRSYHLFVPGAVRADRPTPVVFAFHGAGGQGRDMLCCRNAARARGWLLICPDGLDHGWHLGARDPAKAAQAESDAALVPALLEAVSQDYAVDRTRVYATGFSNGGGMAARLGARFPEWFGAVASVGHTLTKATAAQFPPSRALSVLIMIGANDAGLGDHGKAVGVGSLSAADAARRWAEFDNCGEPTTTSWAGAGPGDPSTIRETRYSGGREGSEVLLYWLEGIGHQWLQRRPGGPQFDAAEVIFEFFARHQRGAAGTDQAK